MCQQEWHDVNQYHTNMKKNYFFTMLAVVLLAVTGVRAQDKAAFALCICKVFGSYVIMCLKIRIFRSAEAE